MNYACNIHASFSDYYTNIFEWNKSKIYFLRKIPLYKIDKHNMLILMTYDDIIIFNIKHNRNNIYMFCDNENAIIIKLNNKGRVIKKSSLLYNEERIILSYIPYLNYNDNFIKEYHSINNYNFITENEYNKIMVLKSNLKKIKDKQKLQYIYYECTNEIIYNKYLSKIMLLVLKDIDIYYSKISFFIKLFSMN